MSRAVGRYRILRELGRGGMATVHLARQIDLDRLVALKELAALRLADASLAHRFLREARMAGSLSHPNVVTVHDYLLQDGTPYIAMEYVEHGSLRPHVGSLSLAQVGGVLEGVLAGLAHAERHGIVHRDLKPENIMITGDGRVKIADFGIAKATTTVRTTAALTSAGTAIGTPSYMAPEQALAEDVGPWTDLYSLGLMIFELVVGRLPYAGTDEPIAVLLRQINEPIARPLDLAPGLDPRVSAWIEWLAAKEPAERPQSAAEAWDGLEPTLIDLLGPRWRRDSGLPQLDAGRAPYAPIATPSQVDTPVTEPFAPSFVDTPALSRAASSRTTDQLDDLWVAATVAPRAPLPGGEQAADAPPRRGRRDRGGVRRMAPFLMLAVLVLVVAGALASQRSGSAIPTSASVTPSAPAASPTAQPVSQSADTAAAIVQVAQSTGAAAPSGDLTAKASAARENARSYDKAATSVEALPGGSGQASTAAIAAALRQTASDYRTAATAADQNDQPGYDAAMTAVGSDRSAVQSAITAAGGAPAAPTQGVAPQPSPQTPSAPQQGGSCAGDSASDDPSDDACDPSGSSDASNPSNPPNPPNPPTPPTPPSNP